MEDKSLDLKHPTYFKVIAAMELYRGIGRDNALPWPSLSKDCQYYTKLTGSPCDKGKKIVNIRGRLTWDAAKLPVKSRPDVINIVISTTLKTCPEYVHYLANSFQDAISISMSPPLCHQVEQIWIMGGQGVYEEAVKSPLCSHVHLTRLFSSFECDRFFPKFEEDYFLTVNGEIESEIQEENGVRYKFEIYQRNTGEEKTH